MCNYPKVIFWFHQPIFCLKCSPAVAVAWGRRDVFFQFYANDDNSPKKRMKYDEVTK